MRDNGAMKANITGSVVRLVLRSPSVSTDSRSDTSSDSAMEPHTGRSIEITNGKLATNDIQTKVSNSKVMILSIHALDVQRRCLTL